MEPWTALGNHRALRRHGQLDNEEDDKGKDNVTGLAHSRRRRGQGLLMITIHLRRYGNASRHKDSRMETGTLRLSV